jgi:hypothetical protein
MPTLLSAIPLPWQYSFPRVYFIFQRKTKLWRKTMDEAQQPDLKRSRNEDDEAIAHSLAAALCEDDVEKFLQLYDEIPEGVSLERVSNIYNFREYLHFPFCELFPEAAVNL